MRIVNTILQTTGAVAFLSVAATGGLALLDKKTREQLIERTAELAQEHNLQDVRDFLTSFNPPDKAHPSLSPGDNIYDVATDVSDSVKSTPTNKTNIDRATWTSQWTFESRCMDANCSMDDFMEASYLEFCPAGSVHHDQSNGVIEADVKMIDMGQHDDSGANALPPITTSGTDIK